MKYEILACDYDGTLACDGAVAAPALEALRQFRAAGGRLLMVTGRRLEDLLRIFAHVELFERIVAENGAVLFRPSSGEYVNLSQPPPAQFVQRLRERGVQPLEIGRVIIATRGPQEIVVLETIRDLGLELQVIFNKGAVMVLPSGVNKASGLKKAFKELNLIRESVVGIGDAENDHALLELCGFSVAVANALPALKEHADWVTPSADGAGVAELIQKMMEEALAHEVRG